MILWHVGATVAIARYVFRDPAMDLRWVAAGSLLPDVLDKPIGALFFNDIFGTHRLWAHALLFPVLLLFGSILATRRAGALRKGLIGLVIGMFIHLLLDGAWVDPEAFLWPLFGFEFPEIIDSDLGALVSRMVRDPLVWIGEAAGLGYLAWLWLRRLSPGGGLRTFARDGKIPLGTAGGAPHE